jgi:hypothetical protein
VDRFVLSVRASACIDNIWRFIKAVPVLNVEDDFVVRLSRA